MNSFIKTGFSVGTAWATRAVEENARTELQRTAWRDFGSNMDGRRAGEKVAGKLSRVISETPSTNQIRPFGEHNLLMFLARCLARRAPSLTRLLKTSSYYGFKKVISRPTLNTKFKFVLHHFSFAIRLTISTVHDFPLHPLRQIGSQERV